MKFTVITHVNHTQKGNQYFGYAPYTREMNIWLKYVDELILVAPLSNGVPTAIDLDYKHDKIRFKKVPNFNFINLKNGVISICKLPLIFLKIFQAMKSADHIHLRCPGNMGLIACIVQIFFPTKIKTAKYAGNWDPKSKQPLTYKLQKYILTSTFMTRNMQVLVYGDWQNHSKNVKPFFTATYSESEKETFQKTEFDDVVEFIFVGSLVAGKTPMYAIKLVEKLLKLKKNIVLNLYGDGIEKVNLEEYIKASQLDLHIFVHGNKDKETLKKAYQKSHFVILPSKSEGWPKAVAEAMFWGCVPVATKVSCVPTMLDYGKRGILLDMNLKEDTNQIEKILKDKSSYVTKSQLAAKWSQQYTTDLFEAEVEKLLK
ncbi:glycosyltransferase [Flavobacterium pectinovorum]|uniref:glycosyltransferase n=1 Tax=Flavobacterium pectinovorum TaxID=29533 RepID=UPI00265E9ED7|nr:glycosyltransferase [Flavobacterium pectinovorum]WKL45954.1 glycosyltransferase [Flavobacterium pectinovorum]